MIGCNVSSLNGFIGLCPPELKYSPTLYILPRNIITLFLPIEFTPQNFSTKASGIGGGDDEHDKLTNPNANNATITDVINIIKHKVTFSLQACLILASSILPYFMRNRSRQIIVTIHDKYTHHVFSSLGSISILNLDPVLILLLSL